MNMPEPVDEQFAMGGVIERRGGNQPLDYIPGQDELPFGACGPDCDCDDLEPE